MLLMGRYRGRPQGVIALRGKTLDGGDWHVAVVPSVRDNPAVAVAWARGQVRQLEDRYAVGRCDRSALERTIITTSLRFGVLCRFTAYLAIDGAAVVNEGGEVHQITQPVEMPAGWGAVALEAAACYAAPKAMRVEDMQLCMSHPAIVAASTNMKTEAATSSDDC